MVRGEVVEVKEGETGRNEDVGEFDGVIGHVPPLHTVRVIAVVSANNEDSATHPPAPPIREGVLGYTFNRNNSNRA